MCTTIYVLTHLCACVCSYMYTDKNTRTHVYIYISLSRVCLYSYIHMYICVCVIYIGKLVFDDLRNKNRKKYKNKENFGRQHLHRDTNGSRNGSKYMRKIVTFWAHFDPLMPFKL